MANCNSGDGTGAEVPRLGRRGLAGAGLLGWATALPLGAIQLAAAQPAVVANGELVVTLLGTGSPVPLPNRFGPSTLVEAGGHRLLFDAGRGAPIRLDQMRITLGSINAVFVTHYHSDHINGLPDVWMSSYLPAGFGGRTKPLRLLGPRGIARLADNLVLAFGDDMRIRPLEGPTPAVATQIEHHEFTADGVVFDEDGIRVTAFEVDHGPAAKPAVGYRIDYAGRSVLISGDTRLNENLIRHGQGVDLLIHEVCAMPDRLKDNATIQAIMALHTPPEDAAEVFNRTRPRLAAYTHIVSLGTPDIPPLSSHDIEGVTRATYHGPLAIGEDLMRFTVGDTVSVRRWSPALDGK